MPIARAVCDNFPLPCVILGGDLNQALESIIASA